MGGSSTSYVRLVCGASPTAGSTYTPITASTWDTNVYQGIGGYWNQTSAGGGTHLFTASNVVSGTLGSQATIYTSANQAQSGPTQAATAWRELPVQLLDHHDGYPDGDCAAQQYRTPPGPRPVSGGRLGRVGRHGQPRQSGLPLAVGPLWGDQHDAVLQLQWRHDLAQITNGDVPPGAGYATASDLTFNGAYYSFDLTGTGTLNQGYNGFGFSSGYDYAVVCTVPEPASLLSLAAALAGLAAYAWRKRQRV